MKYIKIFVFLALTFIYPTITFANVDTVSQLQGPVIGSLQTVIASESPCFMALQSVKGMPDTITAEFIANGETVATIKGNRVMQVKPCYVDKKQNVTIELAGSGLPNKANFKFEPVVNEICGELFVNVIPKDSNIAGEMGVSVIPNDSSINGQFSITIK